MRILFFLSIIGVFAFSNACNQQEKLPLLSERILASSVNLPIHEGGTKSKDCKIRSVFGDRDVNIECIFSPISEKTEPNYPFPSGLWENYGRLITEQGYEVKSREGMAVTYEKTLPNGCKKSLGLILWLNGDPEKAKRALQNLDYEGLH